MVDYRKRGKAAQKMKMTNAAADLIEHQAAERNALKVVAFQQLDDRVIA